ncbi:MAG: hemerythrin family protein [Aquificae bacterium]|nr:hemerythrin family protein [Aquificota bacterium]
MLVKKEQFPKVVLNEMNDIHSTEIDILNQLYEALKDYQQQKTSQEDVSKLLEEFLKDVREHFAFEQGLMEEYQFFAYPMHRAEHDRVLMELLELKKEWEKEKNPNTLLDYLENQFVPWIVNHVQTMDTVTAMYLSNFLK